MHILKKPDQTHPAADVKNRPDLPGPQRHQPGELLSVLPDSVWEAGAAPGEDQPLPFQYDPILVLLGLGEVLGGDIGEPDPVPAIGPGNLGPVPAGPGDPAPGPLVGRGAVAQAVVEVFGGEEALPVGVVAGGVVGEVGRAGWDRG